MTFYVDHMRPAISVCPQTRLCSNKCAMTRKGVDLDIKLPSTLEKSSSMKTNTSFCKRIALEASS